MECVKVYSFNILLFFYIYNPFEFEILVEFWNMFTLR